MTALTARRRRVRRLRSAALVAAAAATALSTQAVAQAAPQPRGVAASAPRLASADLAASARRARPAAAPTIAATVVNGRLSLAGARTMRPGVVRLSLSARGKRGWVEVVRFTKGYSPKSLNDDLAAFGMSMGPSGPSPEGRRHLANAMAHTVAVGGLQAQAGSSSSGLLRLDAPGNYVIFEFSSHLPRWPHLLRVLPGRARTALPKSPTITALSTYRFAVPRKLPPAGRLTFANRAPGALWHEAILQRVKPGTTRQQVINSFQGPPSAGPPPFALPGGTATGFVSPGHAMALDYRLPKGQYAVFCFVPDPQTGMPHAMMGMVDMVKVG